MQPECEAKLNNLEIALKEKLAKVIKCWQDENLELSSPNSRQEIINCFSTIKRRLSKDIVEFYGDCGGMTAGEMDESLLSVWTLEKVKEENLAASELTYFADFLIESHRYAFMYEDENTSSIYSDCESADFVKVADSLEHFFDLYLSNPNDIGLFKE